MPDRIPPAIGSVQSLALRRAEACYKASFASVSIGAYSALKNHITSILHPSELNYFMPLPAERRKVSFLLGRYAAKKALCEHVNEADFSKINILAGIFKNPVVCYPMDYPWQVSITHTDQLACAIAFPMVHPMALDVERVDADKVKVMATQCGQSERKELEQCGLDYGTACTLLWTAKEAISKSLRTGMTCPFEFLELHSITRLGKGEFEGLYKNLGQYKFRSWILNDFVLTMTMPKKTEIEFGISPPFLPSIDDAPDSATSDPRKAKP